METWIPESKIVSGVKYNKGPHVEPGPLQGSLVDNNPLDMVCMDIMKKDPSNNSKGDVLVSTDTFYKFKAAVVTPNQEV